MGHSGHFDLFVTFRPFCDTAFAYLRREVIQCEFCVNQQKPVILSTKHAIVYPRTPPSTTDAGVNTMSIFRTVHPLFHAHRTESIHTGMLRQAISTVAASQ